jgi:transposase-like protein
MHSVAGLAHIKKRHTMKMICRFSAHSFRWTAGMLQITAYEFDRLLPSEKSINQLASEHGVHVTQLRKWKRKVLDGLPNLFRAEQDQDEAVKRLEAEQERLYAEIGRLTTQLSWLKKKGIEVE